MRLLLAAFPPELGFLLESPPAGWRCACVGAGAISAAAATARLLAEQAPSQVVFVGSCGTYLPVHSIGELFGVEEVFATSLEEVRGEAYRPDIEPRRWRADVLLPLLKADVVVTPAITRSVEGARALAAHGSLEHLELSGVFEACRQAGVPCGAGLVVANEVGPRAHEQWQTHHAEGSRSLIERLVQVGFFAGE